MVDHPNIKNASSLVDYIFRLLAFEYLDRTDLVHVTPAELEQNSRSSLDLTTDIQDDPIENRPVAPLAQETAAPRLTEIRQAGQGLSSTNKAYQNMMGDAPACNVCGHITLRSGTCYKCMNCGNSMGCS